MFNVCVLAPPGKNLDLAFVGWLSGGGVQGIECDVITNLHANFGAFVQSYRVLIEFVKI